MTIPVITAEGLTDIAALNLKAISAMNILVIAGEGLTDAAALILKTISVTKPRFQLCWLKSRG